MSMNDDLNTQALKDHILQLEEQCLALAAETKKTSKERDELAAAWGALLNAIDSDGGTVSVGGVPVNENVSRLAKMHDAALIAEKDKRIAELAAALGTAQIFDCRECGGTGARDNHVTGRVECSNCKGIGQVVSIEGDYKAILDAHDAALSVEKDKRIAELTTSAGALTFALRNVVRRSGLAGFGSRGEKEVWFEDAELALTKHGREDLLTALVKPLVEALKLCRPWIAGCQVQSYERGVALLSTINAALAPYSLTSQDDPEPIYSVCGERHSVEMGCWENRRLPLCATCGGTRKMAGAHWEGDHLIEYVVDCPDCSGGKKE